MAMYSKFTAVPRMVGVKGAIATVESTFEIVKSAILTSQCACRRTVVRRLAACGSNSLLTPHSQVQSNK